MRAYNNNHGCPSQQTQLQGVRGALTWAYSCFRPSPTPSQLGRTMRVCVQAKIQGMARRVSTPPPFLRLPSRAGQ